MIRLAPKTVRGKLWGVYLSLVVLFSIAGVFIVFQLVGLNEVSRDFFQNYTATEELIIESRFLIDEISHTVLDPPLDHDAHAYALKMQEQLSNLATRYDETILPQEDRAAIAAALRAHGDNIEAPLLMANQPNERMEEADLVAELCRQQAVRAGEVELLHNIIGIVDAYTDVLLNNDPAERQMFDDMVRFVEGHNKASVVSHFPELKQKAIAVFDAQKLRSEALQEFKTANRSLGEKLAGTDRKFHAEFLLPGQSKLTGHMQNISILVFSVLLFTILLATIVSLTLARRIWVPLAEMKWMIGQMAKGRLEKRLPIVGEDETAEVKGLLNDLAETLQQTLVKLDQQVTEQKLIETELRKSEQFNRDLSNEYQFVLDGISESLVVVNREREIIWSNRKASEEFFSEVDAKVASEEYEMGEDSSFYFGLEQVDLCFTSGENVEEVILTPEGRHFQIKAFPLKDEEGNTVRVLRVMADVSESFLFREEADRSNRLASLGELSAGIAHEINNPNGLIALNAPIAKEAIEDALPILDEYFEKNGDFFWGGLPYSRMRKDLPGMVQEMCEGSHRIQRIVEDLKNFVRQGDVTDLEKIDLNIAVETAVRLARNSIRKATDNFVLDLRHRLPLINGYTVQLEQVAVNLIQNACLALPERDRELLVRTTVSDDGESVLLIVRDEGCGIPPDIIKRVTDPFFTTRRQKGGTGLGLSVTNRIVRDHGGKLIIDSKPGEWTKVTVRFPIADLGGV